MTQINLLDQILTKQSNVCASESAIYSAGKKIITQYVIVPAIFTLKILAAIKFIFIMKTYVK